MSYIVGRGRRVLLELVQASSQLFLSSSLVAHEHVSFSILTFARRETDDSKSRAQ